MKSMFIKMNKDSTCNNDWNLHIKEICPSLGGSKGKMYEIQVKMIATVIWIAKEFIKDFVLFATKRAIDKIINGISSIETIKENI